MSDNQTIPGDTFQPFSVGTKPIKDVFDQLADKYARAKAGRPIGATTGSKKLNRLLGGGFQPGQVYIIGAPPGTGKSALALDLCREASRRGDRAVYIAYEVGPKDCRIRALAAISQTDAEKFTLGTIDPAPIERTYRQQLEEETQGIYFVDATLGTVKANEEYLDAVIVAAKTGMSAGSPEATADSKYGLLIVIDYLQMAARLAGLDGEGEMRGKVALFSNILARLAKRHEVPIIALSSVARGKYAAEAMKSFDCFKEAGDIESDADVCLTLGVRDGDEWDDVKGMEKRPLLLRVLKNRHGKTGNVRLEFNAPCQSFRWED
jgi:replicative DNA helicase